MEVTCRYQKNQQTIKICYCHSVILHINSLLFPAWKTSVISHKHNFILRHISDLKNVNIHNFCNQLNYTRSLRNSYVQGGSNMTRTICE